VNDPRFELRVALGDRLVTSYPARRFHIELSHAELGGGGRIAGRVHRDRDWPGGRLEVRVRCCEAWRPRIPAGSTVILSRRSAPPRWHEQVLWQDSADLGPLHDRWLGFSFELPEHLPPAIEARSLAWRYEVEARRPTRFRLAERALLTPLAYTAVSADGSRRLA
jgi:hypothetical protein